MKKSISKHSPKRINIFYIFPVRIPSKKAHSIQVINTISALHENKNNVFLFCPKRKINRIGSA
ncbi:MAG: hypothetical protein ACTSVV_09000, partial [Promethearchaeota archaeon]